MGEEGELSLAPSQEGSPSIGRGRPLQHPLMCSRTPAHCPAACLKFTKIAGGASLARMPRRGRTAAEGSKMGAFELEGYLRSPLTAGGYGAVCGGKPAMLAVVASPRQRAGCHCGAGCGGGAGDAAP